MSGAIMTEDQARAALRDFDGAGGMEQWIAKQPWQPTLDGWTVLTSLGGWRFLLRSVPGGVRVSALSPGDGAPAVWLVTTGSRVTDPAPHQPDSA
jgi:hypothetical protein